jgi:hypothetical protein
LIYRSVFYVTFCSSHLQLFCILHQIISYSLVLVCILLSVSLFPLLLILTVCILHLHESLLLLLVFPHLLKLFSFLLLGINDYTRFSRSFYIKFFGVPIYFMLSVTHFYLCFPLTRKLSESLSSCILLTDL